MRVKYDGKHKCIKCGVDFIDKKHKDRKYCGHSCSITGDGNPMWMGERVSYTAIHMWIAKKLPNKGVCTCCGEEKRTDAHNISGEYKRDILDWEWLCRKCHMTKDGRLAEMVKRNKKTKLQTT